MDNVEWFDVVNTLDLEIGKERRDVVHARKLFHRAVHVLILDATDRILVQKRSLAKDSAPGLWCSSCSGHLDAGEGYLPAALRELDEEVGLKISPENLAQILSVSPCMETGWEFCRVFFLRNDGPYAFEPSEITELRSLALHELDDWVSSAPDEFSASFLHLFRMARLSKPLKLDSVDRHSPLHLGASQ
ncbi:MAG: NUDIX hydrolase [Opitutae bacterium]|nr:NUDIX hydrolase [Opitutae bacterium]